MSRPLRPLLLLLGAGLSLPALAVDPAAPPAEEALEESAPAVAAAPTVVEEGFLSETLENGLKVSILSDPDMPIVATQIWVQVGSAHEASNEAGFAHLFEHLMFGATSNHDKEAYSRHHTINGGSENAYTSFDNTVYISEIGPLVHDQVLVLEADRMANLVLSQDNLDNEKKIVTEELRLRTENNPVSRLLGPALEGLFGDHPYGHSPAGTKEDLAAADLGLVQKFYEGYYAPANMHLVVVGPVPGAETFARVEALFGGIDKERLVPPEVQALSGLKTGERVTLQEDLPPIKIAAVTYFGPQRTSPDYWSYRLMTEMLAGGELDRFREELVTNQGKAMEATSLAEELEAGGMLAFASISLPFRGKNKAFKLVHGAVDALGSGAWLSQETLETARRRLLRDELERSYYAASMAESIGTAFAWQGDDRLALGGATEAIDAVTLDQVKDSWRRYVAEAGSIELFIKKGKATAPADTPDTPSADTAADTAPPSTTDTDGGAA